MQNVPSKPDHVLSYMPQAPASLRRVIVVSKGWIVFGWLALMAGLVSLLGVSSTTSQWERKHSAFIISVSVLQLLLGVPFLIAGVASLRGSKGARRGLEVLSWILVPGMPALWAISGWHFSQIAEREVDVIPMILVGGSVWAVLFGISAWCLRSRRLEGVS